MSASVNGQILLSALASLETCLMTPRVPGELEPWVDYVKTAIESVGTALAQQIENEHRALFNQITAQDSDLYARVGRLKSGDVQSLEQCKTLRERVHSLDKDVPQVEPDEGRLESKLLSFCANGLSFVLHVREQEVAIDTWFQEAFERDRGVGD